MLIAGLLRYHYPVRAQWVGERLVMGHFTTVSRAMRFYDEAKGRWAEEKDRIIAVGTPVAGRSPHRSQRAVFSHWALQFRSLCTDLPVEFLLSIYRFHNARPWGSKMRTHFVEARPGVTASLGSSIQPLKQQFRTLPV